MLAGVLAMSTGVAHAAPGDVTSTAFTPPASVSGSTLRASFSDGESGSFQVYASGQSHSIIRLTGKGATDATFNSGAPVAIGVPTALQSSGVIRVGGTTHRATTNWWVVTSPNDLNSFATAGLTITSGTRSGSVSFTRNLSGASILAKCTEMLAGSNTFQSPGLQPRRNGGVWLVVMCGVAGNTFASQIAVPLTPSGEFDTAARNVSFFAAHGSSASCVLQPGVVADPTSKAPAPELWVVRAEHNHQENGHCASSVRSTNASSISSRFVSLVSLAVTADGAVTRTVLPTTKPVTAGGMRVDPGGRVVFLASEIVDTTKVSLSRLSTNGSLDSTIGTNGYLSVDIGALPAGATFAMSGLVGMVTTADRVYFVIQVYDAELQTYQNNSTTPRSHGYRMGLLSPTGGWETRYGSRGLGTRVTTVLPENSFSLGRIAATGQTVDSAGQPMNYTFDANNAIQLNVWSSISGATGGGEGGTGTGGFTRDTGGAPSPGTGGATGVKDARVYTALPSGVRVNKAFTVLSAAGAKSAGLVSRTRSVCVVSGRHVVMIGAGTCRVTVTNKRTGAAMRTLATRVGATGSSLGTDIKVGGPIRFAKANAAISRAARGQLTTIANDAKGAEAVIVVGHAAELNESAFNFAISRDRAVAVSRALRYAEVTAPITTAWRGAIEQISTVKTERSQAQNRRVIVYTVP